MKDEYIAETKVVKIAKSVITKTTAEENLLCPALSKNGISPLLPEMQIEIQVILKNNKSETKNAAASLKSLASFFVESLISSDESRQFIPTYKTGYKTLPLSVISILSEEKFPTEKQTIKNKTTGIETRDTTLIPFTPTTLI